MLRLTLQAYICEHYINIIFESYIGNKFVIEVYGILHRSVNQYTLAAPLNKLTQSEGISKTYISGSEKNKLKE
jgi:hypothetical protein